MFKREVQEILLCERDVKSMQTIRDVTEQRKMKDAIEKM